MQHADADPLSVQRNLVLGLLLALATMAWVVLGWQASSADMAASPPTGMRALPFLVFWVAMMVAMMLPSAAPMILTFHRIQAGKREPGQTFVATWIFVAAYMVVWALAYLAAVGGEAVATWAALSSADTARIGGVILVAAGIYQVEPLKDACLSKCRAPITFIITFWRDGSAGAMRIGLLHGVYCLGCCWFLFVVLFPLGLMNLAAMAAISLLIFAEKALPWGRGSAPIAAGALIAYGGLVLGAPQLLPTFAPGTMAMPNSAGPMPMH